VSLPKLPDYPATRLLLLPHPNPKSNIVLEGALIRDWVSQLPSEILSQCGRQLLWDQSPIAAPPEFSQDARADHVEEVSRGASPSIERTKSSHVHDEKQPRMDTNRRE
jgi:hypothetical protein